MKVIFDCDLTFGIPGCDVDDGMALLYLLGSSNVALVGITNSFGNSNMKTVVRATGEMLKALNRQDIPVYAGCKAPNIFESEAVDFLVQQVDKQPGEISILATGSLTNLFGASQQDPDFFEKTKEIVVMGGIQEALQIGRKGMKELNFASDPEAAMNVLCQGNKVSVITGNHCINAFCSTGLHQKRLHAIGGWLGKYIYMKTPRIGANTMKQNLAWRDFIIGMSWPRHIWFLPGCFIQTPQKFILMKGL